ncbi:type IV toxin-antitoxin system AbiEi family antitoxin domain-containing protein [Blastococcus brunescens]|uniref:Type IV toxin-antitoxin system AbiEi family antitoxin domain-containing protein n=1 Tax=Blastococcus brunescens TaxID=1564165 RepID=A0ABZ1B0U0_9ACTN|nr:type IV toxin-antitoxin system AbiEi family antitoxin domain-containing protein [Blastococcus sp. BMG 8361]WRL63353.1 type IV toxin-antitoxin system AbiEi family antitoxin domain-containing protein [Blastococcus sp. BMG 8361]
MHPLLRAVAERQLGLFTAADARRAGYEHGEIRHLCSSGTWVRLRRGSTRWPRNSRGQIGGS